MAPVNIKYVVSFSSQDDCHRASNLVTSDGSKVWLSNRKDTSGKSEVILQLEKPSQLAYLDIGAVWCATLEVRVGRSDWPQTMEFKPLITTFILMSPLDCRLSRGFKSTQMFSKKDFSQDVASELWDRLHIICRQPHRRDVQLGLSFIHIRDAGMPLPPANSSPSISGVSPLGKSAINASSIQKHFFGDVNKTVDSPTDRLKYKLMKMAGSTENGCEQEQALSRTAKLVLKASENQKSSSPQRVSSLPRKGLFSEHVAKKNDVPVAEEMKSFLQTLNITVADIDRVTIADLRHKLERKKRRKLTKEERHTFSEICQDFFYDLFEKKNEPVESEKSGSVLGSKVQNDLPETNTIPGKLSIEPVKAKSGGKMQKTSQVNQKEHVHHTDMTALSTTESTVLNTFYNQDGQMLSPVSRTSVEGKIAASTSKSKIFSSVSSSVGCGQIFAGEKPKEKIHHLNPANSDLISHKQKLSLKTSSSSPGQNLHNHIEKQVVTKDDTISHDNADRAGGDTDSTSTFSYDSDSSSAQGVDKLKASSPCPSPSHKIVTTEDNNKSYENANQDKTSASFSSSKTAKLKRLSKASFDIFQEFSMEIWDDDDNVESTGETDGADRKRVSDSKRESFESDSKNGVSSHLDSDVKNSKIVNINSGNGTLQKIKSHNNETGLMKKTPKSAKGKIYRMHTSRNKLNTSHTRNSSDLQQTYKVSEKRPDFDNVRLVNQNCPEYFGSCNTDKYVTSPDKISRCETVPVRATELYAPTFHSTTGNKRMKTSDINRSVPSSHSSDRSYQSSRIGQKSKEYSSRRRTSSNPTTLLQDTGICENCYDDSQASSQLWLFSYAPLGQFPADVLPTHRAFCTPGSAAAISTSPDELLIDETVDCTECPICLQRFPQDVLLVHASECGI